MEKEILYKMVEIDGIRTKDRKLGEELTELRFELLKDNMDTENVILEISQVAFLIAQLDAYVEDEHINLLTDMLLKYDILDIYKFIHFKYYNKIEKTIISEYKKNCERLGI